MVRVLVSLLLWLAAAPALAALQATVDRNPVTFGKPLTLTLLLTGDADGEPDWSALEKNFQVASQNTQTRLTIVNGDLTRTRSWTVLLLARRPGDLTIPALTVGKETSRPLTVSVTRGATREVRPDVAFIEFEVEPAQVYVQQQVLVTMRLFVTPDVLSSSLADPVATGAVLELLGKTTQSHATRGTTQYDVYERRYVLFPEQAGELRVSPPLFQGRLNLHPGPMTPFGTRLPGGATPPVVATAEERTITVLPPPAATPQPWLPATDVTLTEKLVPDAGPYPAGEPITRMIELNVRGQLHTQIAPLVVGFPAGLRTYAQTPDATTAPDNRGVVARQTNAWTLIPEQAGALVLPEVRVAWWDVAANEPRVAVLPQRTLAATPSAAPAASAILPVTPVAAGQPAAADALSRLWPAAAAFALLGWLLTALGWLRAARPRPAADTTAQTLKAVRQALDRALAGGDAQQVRAALLPWARAHFADPGLASLREVARRANAAPLTVALEQLDRALFGGERAWSSAALASALRALPARAASVARTGRLPPLYPA